MPLKDIKYVLYGEYTYLDEPRVYNNEDEYNDKYYLNQY